MNALFHTTAAIGVAVMLTDTGNADNSFGRKALLGGSAFLAGIISHGALDYIPHCYPVNSQLDVILSLIIILLLTFLTNRKYRLITGLAFAGSIFPDIIDLLPQIINKYAGTNIPVADKFFPWHWQEYSGSVFTDNCSISTLNHLLLILVVGVICWGRRTDVKRMINL